MVHVSSFRKTYTRDGKILTKGDKITNKALAKTLKTIANHGNADPFYSGKLAHRFIREVKKHNGVMTVDDLVNYKAVERKPLVSKLGEYTMLNTPPPASGPVLAYILNILKGKVGW